MAGSEYISSGLTLPGCSLYGCCSGLDVARKLWLIVPRRATAFSLP